MVTVAAKNSRSGESDGITRVDLAELIALRARAGKPHAGVVRTRDAAAGGHVSALRGRGMDYAESRVYQAGDDARNIDWRRTARSGKWHTKLFQAERERAMLLVLDTHPTMRFGTRVRYKSVAAARAAAWLAWTSVRGGDRVGALAFGSVRAAVDPHPGARGALAVLGALAAWDEAACAAAAQSAEPLSTALERVLRMVAHGGQVWLLSDGWCVDAAAYNALVRLARRADVRVAIAADALECDAAPAGAYVFETGHVRRMVDLSGAPGRADFHARLARGHDQLASTCDRAGVRWTTLASAEEPELALAALWRRRSGSR